MPEGVRPYPRWEGRLATRSRIGTVAAGELERARRSQWTTFAVALGLALGLASVIEIFQLRRTATPDGVLDAYLAMLDQLRWLVLAVAAAAGGPSILEDVRRGALDLYLSRALTVRDYLAGKALALLALTTLTMVLPSLAYYLVSLMVYDTLPSDWHLAQAAGIGYSLVWCFLVSGVALGLSCLLRSSRAASLVLFGALAGLDVLATRLLNSLTANESLAILSPFAALQSLQPWLFGVDNPQPFQSWWGAVAIVVLTLLGWALVAWRHPRVRGEEGA